MAKGGTPAIDALNTAGAKYVVHEFRHHPGERGFGLAAAAALGVAPERVFKTLVVTADDRQVVGIVPVAAQLSLRGIAAAVGAKRAEMCPTAVAQRVTGYVVGGISPFGQKKPLATVIDESCALFDSIFVSGGKRGLDLELSPQVLVDILGATIAPIVRSP